MSVRLKPMFSSRDFMVSGLTFMSLLHFELIFMYGVDSGLKVKVKIAQSCPTLCDPMDYIVHGILQVRILEWVAFPFSRGSSQPRDWTQVSHIAGGFFTSWVTREAQEYRVISLSLFQRIFPTQELNWGLLHCRRILYQLSHQRSTYSGLVWFFCMWLSSFLSTIYWRYYPFSIVCSFLLCHKLIDHLSVGLFTGSQFCSIELWICFVWVPL